MRKIVRKLREERIPYIISPFESDAQLTHLVNNNFVDFVISEDSDLIPFGAEKVLFKFGRSDPKSKNMNMYYERWKLLRVDPHFPDITAWRRMCIISGCDYLPNLPGIGLQKAKFLMTAFSEGDDSCIAVVESEDPCRFLRVPETASNRVEKEHIRIGRVHQTIQGS